MRLRVRRHVGTRRGDRRGGDAAHPRPPRRSGTSRRRRPPAAPRRRPRPRSSLTVAISASSTSARICRQSGLAIPPPDARIWSAPAYPAASIRSRPSRRPKATPSSTARVRWRRSWPRVSPTKAPRASGSGCGLRSPGEVGQEQEPVAARGHRRPSARRASPKRHARRQRVAEPAQAAGGREHHRHQVPAAGHGVAERVDLARAARAGRGRWSRRRRPRCRARAP